jgi:hypothetical protein
MVAGTADGADGVVGSGLAHGCNPDHPRSRSSLAAEDDLTASRPGPSGRSGAAGIDAELQKIGCASRPLRSVGNELAHTGRHWVGVNEVLDRVPPVIRISFANSTSID